MSHGRTHRSRDRASPASAHRMPSSFHARACVGSSASAPSTSTMARRRSRSISCARARSMNAAKRSADRPAMRRRAATSASARAPASIAFAAPSFCCDARVSRAVARSDRRADRATEYAASRFRVCAGMSVSGEIARPARIARATSRMKRGVGREPHGDVDVLASRCAAIVCATPRFRRIEYDVRSPCRLPTSVTTGTPMSSASSVPLTPPNGIGSSTKSTSAIARLVLRVVAALRHEHQPAPARCRPPRDSRTYSARSAGLRRREREHARAGRARARRATAPGSGATASAASTNAPMTTASAAMPSARAWNGCVGAGATWRYG